MVRIGEAGVRNPQVSEVDCRSGQFQACRGLKDETCIVGCREKSDVESWGMAGRSGAGLIGFCPL
jgi:hypothetical protein